MKSRLFLLAVLFSLAVPAWASKVVVCDPADPTVADRVIAYYPSADTNLWTGDPNALTFADVSAVLGVEPLRYWVCDRVLPGAVAMDAGQKAAVDAADAAAVDTAVRSGADSLRLGFNASGLFHRAFADVLKDEINLLRQWLADFKTETAAANNLADFQSRVATLPNTPDRTLAQLKTALSNRVSSGDVDND